MSDFTGQVPGTEPGTTPGDRARRRRRLISREAAAVAGIGLFGWGNGVLSAGIARLADDLDLSSTVVGAHLLVFAAGLGIAGLGRPRLAHDIDRPAPVVFGLAMTVLALAPSATVSLLAASVMGLAGSPTLAAAQARLGAGGPRGTRLLMWSNVLAALTAALSAALIAALAGGTVAIALVPPVLCGLALVTLVARPGPGAPPADAAPTATTSARVGDHRVDRALLGALALICTIVAIESTLSAHLAPFLSDTGVDSDTALLAPFLLFGGQVVGRVVSTVRPPADPPRALLATFAGVAIAFTPLLVLETPWRLVAVALVGFGIAAQYPLAIVVTLGLDPSRAAMVSSYSTAATSVALISSPTLVGVVTDLATPRVGFAWIGVLLAVGAALVIASVQRTRAAAGSADDDTDPRATAGGAALSARA